MNEKKCIYGHCEHGEEFHDEGVCWKITKEDLTELPTNEKYCQCKRQADLIRRYERVGYMEFDEHTIMATKNCARCKKDFLGRKENDLCLSCKTLASYGISSE